MAKLLLLFLIPLTVLAGQGGTRPPISDVNLERLGFSRTEVNASYELDTSVRRLLRQTRAVGCHSLAPGASTVLNVERGASPTSVELLYALERTSEDVYTATVNLQFQDRRAAPDSQDITRQIKQRIRECMSYVEDALRGPNGEQLKIRLYNTGDPGPIPPPVSVDVVEPRYGTHSPLRATSRRYHMSMDCPTYLHEILHLMGLVDEYREHWIQYRYDPVTRSYVYDEEPTEGSRDQNSVTAYNCRIPGPDSSVMNNPWKAFERALPGGVSIKLCGCMERNCRVEEPYIRQGDECPEGLGILVATSASDVPSAHQMINTWYSNSLDGTKVFILSTLGTRPRAPGESLLSPAHFRALTRPGCARNLSYYGCAHNANSSRTAVQGCALPLLPSRCRGSSFDWINR